MTATMTAAGLADAETVSETESAATATRMTGGRVRYLPTQKVGVKHAVHTVMRA